MKLRVALAQTDSTHASRSGLTTIELLIVIAMIAIMSAAGAAIFARLQPRAQLGDATAEVAQALRTAQTRSSARYNLDAHGVYVQSDSVTLYEGGSYAARETQYDRVVTYQAVQLSPDATDYHFSEGSGLPSVTSDIVITHPTLNIQSTIHVLASGKILLQ
ncbi:MAG: hypothetical protein COU35_04630 [Candidatus Magasanikbacteria bacterium CG10_big_fil_rev_8_21_14_0_10_47_10]|uniref:General secretion pathway GspH domain-containing protein n=1 Tax=Candidatus Magasanikbacteria bacterium CG10_big_fil_rev_8_21_14_0_10_47_10 TaxID=1974652 RepID=A0A2H0TRE8_9BACT|nr:MAG: hypothetical protein COU35_04630 [Candidatus Magasanikbacteria bacterium CG10_big_fil_rev_8_21_14_0_10_47_10]